MGHVHEIVVENFKSYEGRVQIGPFRKFTCVIGPNGAGKSNLMDALSFVLGVKAQVLRSEKLRDLIYRKEGENPKENQRSAYVELKYVSESGSDAEEDAESLVFKRMILKGGEGRFQVNGEAVSQSDYHKRLEGINILSKVRNFLVFQGDVDAVAQRQGKDLTAFFEQISGSEAFRQEYERLAAEKAKREDNARYLFTKKRNAVNEKKRVTQQKQEAEEYRARETERRNMQREFYLFRLHTCDRQLEEVETTRGGVEADQAEINGLIETARQALDEADRDRARAHLETGKADRAVKNSRVKLDRVVPERVANKSRLNHLNQRIEDLKVHNAQDGNRTQQIESQLQALRDQKSQLEAESAAIKQHIESKKVTFTPQQRKKFEQARMETERLTAANNERSRELQHQIQMAGGERTKAERDQRELLARQAQLQQQVAELTQHEATAKEALTRESARAQEKGTELDRLQERVGESAEEKQGLQNERQMLAERAQDINATEQQIQRERNMTKVCADLMEAMPGVYGRVVDLCRPSQQRLRVAVNVVLGKNLDSIIVDSAATAHKCVSYLKERMLVPMTFLPLTDLQVPDVDPRLEELVKNNPKVRLALNCISFDERYNRAFYFMLAGAVVADTMTDARKFAYGEARQMGVSCNIVTIAGEKIAKNGNLSVSEAAREGATRFDVSELDIVKNRMEEIHRRLSAISSLESAGGADVATIQQEVKRAEEKAADANSRLHWCQGQLAVKQQELRSTGIGLEKTGLECTRTAKHEADLQEEQRKIEERISKGSAGCFAELNAEMGLADVRKAEREWRRESETARQREDDILRQLSNVKAELSMLEQTQRERTSANVEELMPKLLAEKQQSLQQENAFSKQIEALEAEIQGLETNAKNCLEAEREKEKMLAKLRQENSDRRQQLMAIEKRLGDLGSEHQSLRDGRIDLIRQTVFEDIEIPLLQGSFEALQDLAEAPSQPASAPTQRPPDASAEELVVDYTSLPEEKKAASFGPAAKMLEEEYRAELERLHVELQRLSPNLKAIDQMQGVVEHVQAASHEADVARKDIEEVETQFETVRKARKERFMNCFQKVAAEISGIYKRLTAYTAGLQSDGGSAYLDLEDTEDPFNAGIKFTAMPPAKRFRDMHLLSGGEKTLAAMALLFAVHAYQKPPFMVLDEVDAALDANNVTALGNYIEKADVQTIVISLKDRFFIRSKALVGVWKNKPKETSAVLTLDLSQYKPGATA